MSFHSTKSSVIPEAVDKSIPESLQMGFMHSGWQDIYHKSGDIGSRTSDATTQELQYKITLASLLESGVGFLICMLKYMMFV